MSLRPGDSEVGALWRQSLHRWDKYLLRGRGLQTLFCMDLVQAVAGFEDQHLKDKFNKAVAIVSSTIELFG